MESLAAQMPLQNTRAEDGGPPPQHADLGAAIFRRKAIYEELQPETKAGGDRRSESMRKNQNENSAFCSATADTTGKSCRSVEIAAARGEALGDDLGAVTGTSLDKGMELDALAKLPKDERKGLIDRAKAGERGFAEIEIRRS